MKELETLIIKIPISWNKQSLSFDNTSCIFLTKILAVATYYGQEILTDYVKEIVVYVNMMVRVRVAREPIDLNNLGKTSDKITSLEDLENIISLVNETPVSAFGYEIDQNNEIMDLTHLTVECVRL